jgi:hypothetical protein
MSSIIRNLRAIVDAETHVLLGQALLTHGRLIAPLHVLDPALVAGGRALALGRVDRAPAARPTLALLSQQPAADAAIWSVDDERESGRPLTFASHVGRGAAVAIHCLTPRQRMVIGYVVIAASIRDMVLVDRYAYRTASGNMIQLAQVGVLFLDRSMAPGASGAPICLAGSTRIVGFVHGNAEANAGGAVALDPRP